MPAPVLTGLTDFAVDSADVDGPHLLDASITFSDADGDFDGAVLVVSGIWPADEIGILETGTGPGQIDYDEGTGTIWYGGVAIAQRDGGYGSDLIITFNAQATAAGIEAVTESLTFQNNDGASGARTLTYTFFDAAGHSSGSGINEAFGAANPFFSLEQPPYVVDVDNDGALDLVFGSSNDPLRYFRNTGTNEAPAYTELTGAANPFAAISGIVRLIRDLDSDGDLDVYVTAPDGFLMEFRNTGSAASPVYATAWLGFEPQSSLTMFGDVDNDGDIDAVVSDYSTLRYFENTGTNAAAVWTERTGAANPFSTIGPGYADVSLGDVDSDGDLDVFLMSPNAYEVFYFENIGTASAAVYAQAANPFGRIFNIVPFGRLQDVDGDGDTDFLVRMADGATVFMRNDGPFQTLTITINDVPSTVQDDLIVAGEGGITYGYNVFLDNGSGADTDPDSGIVVTEVNGSAADVNQQITLASGAVLALYGDGWMAYDAGAAFDYLTEGQIGFDSFTYTVVGGDTAMVTVQIIGIAGTSGDDHIVSDGAGRILSAGRGDDYVDGGSGDDTLNGGDGADYLKGGDGADTLRGGTGADTYVVDDAGDITDETGGDGTDLVWSRISWTLGAAIEHLTLGAAGGAIDGAGNELGNLITGNTFANTLLGLGGGDILLGGGGVDTLYGGDDDDGLDGGTQDDVLFGGDGWDDLIGGAGHDRLDGGTGGDDMVGGLGNDTYVVDDFYDTVTELAGQGIDHVEAWFSFTLSADVEHLTLMGLDNIVGVGNALRNTITGNGGHNTLDGGGELDILFGDAGADTLLGGLGADLLDGGADDDILRGQRGNDKLTGAAGADTFLFGEDDLIAPTVETDQILDLVFADGDVIDLSAIDANTLADGDQAFVWAAKFTKVAGQATLKYASGTTTLELDVDGDGKADFRIAITGDHSGTKGDLYDGGADTDGGWIL